MTDDKRQQLTEIIERMAYIQNRSDLYVSADLAPIVNFLHGFHAACDAVGLPSGYDRIYEQIARERGWRWSSQNLDSQMRQRGYDDTAIANELLAIELEAWKRRLEFANQRIRDESPNL